MSAFVVLLQSTCNKDCVDYNKSMKLILMLLILSVNALGGELEVLDIKVEDRSRVFEVVTDSPATLVVLDCASFIHNLSINKRKESFLYYLTVTECREIHNYINEIYFSQRRCIRYDLNGVSFNDCE